MDWCLAQGQIFGGCCANVFLFETLIQHSQRLNGSAPLGPLVTLAQFVTVAVVSYFQVADFSAGAWRRGFIRPFPVPPAKILLCGLMFYVSSVINNSVWKYGISLPMHIMFRSAAPVFTMIVGTCVQRRRYTLGQILASALMSLGVVLIFSQSAASTPDSATLRWLYFWGVGQLTFASLLSAYLGLYTEALYAKYGSHWQHMMFGMNLMAVPMLLGTTLGLLAGLQEILTAVPRLTVGSVSVLHQFLYLCMNACTQVVCSRGVNCLSGLTSSLTVTVVLLLRKFASLLISAVVFGTKFTVQGYVGSVILLIGTLHYAFVTRRLFQEKKKRSH